MMFTWPDVDGAFSGIRFWCFPRSGPTNLLDYDMVEWGYGEAPAFTLRVPPSPTGSQFPCSHTCDGTDDSPPLAWNKPDSTTQSFALIVDDPDAPGGTWTHWVNIIFRRIFWLCRWEFLSEQLSPITGGRERTVGIPMDMAALVLRAAERIVIISRSTLWIPCRRWQPERQSGIGRRDERTYSQPDTIDGDVSEVRPEIL